MLQIVQYRKRCIGCNACVEALPFRWRISRKDGKSLLVGGRRKRDHFITEVGPDELEGNLRAAKNCPVRIIHVKELYG